MPTIIFANTAKPGTEVLGIDVSYKNRGEIQSILEEKVREFEAKPQRFILQNKTYEIFPSEMGIKFDINRTVSQIKHIKDTGLVNTFQNLHSKIYIDPKVQMKQDMVLGHFQNDIAQNQVKNAGVILAEDGELRIVEGRSGLMMDKDRLFADLQNNISTLSSTQIRINTEIQNPTVAAFDIEKHFKQIENQLYESKVLKFEQQSFQLKLIDHIDWITFTKEKDLNINGLLGGAVGAKLKITLDGKKVKEYVAAEIAEDIEKEAQGVVITRDENKMIHFDGSAENGLKITEAQFIQMLEISLNEGVNSFEIPTKIVKADTNISKDLRELGVKELIGSGHTSFYGSPTNRIHNIQTGIRKYNGLIVKPGDKFSFNANLGLVEAITGFLPELVIKPEGTLPEYGGGLCQVSTTMYRAAIFAGLPILERAAHSYAVSYYSQVLGYGLDATIYPGVSDIVFLNDTPGHILIQAYTDGMNAYYKFYGTSDGREVWMEGPYLSNYTKPLDEPERVETDELPVGEEKQVEKAHTGFDAVWYRYIKKGDDVKKEVISTRYKATRAKFMVGKEKPSEGEI